MKKAEKRARRAEKKAWKRARPEKGIPWVAPTLWVEDPRGAADLYERAFGFEPRSVSDGWVELRHRKGLIMVGKGPLPGRDDLARSLGRGTAPQTHWTPLATPNVLGGSTINIYVYVADVDALAIRAANAGCTVVSPPRDEPFGDRCVRIVDPFGHCWMFATHCRRDSDVPPPFKGE